VVGVMRVAGMLSDGIVLCGLEVVGTVHIILGLMKCPIVLV